MKLAFPHIAPTGLLVLLLLLGSPAVSGGMAMVLLGAVIGLGAWYQLLPWTREFVDGIDSAGSLVPLSVALVVDGSCLFATLIPAVRATQVDLVGTLKAD